MKAIMYHYIRPTSEGYPFFRFLHLEHFLQQLDWLKATYGFASREEFVSTLTTKQPCNGVVLTFDDGFSDHFHHVFPVLKERGLWGIFFIPTRVFSNAKLLDVHRIHLVIGKVGGVRAMEILEDLITEEMLTDQYIEDFKRKTYRRQDNDAATNRFKRTLNYFIAYEWRESVLDRLVETTFNDDFPKAPEFYLTPSQTKELHDHGMMIGSHSVNHFVFSKLGTEQQQREIQESFTSLENIVGEKISSFCYPYGGFHTFTSETESLLSHQGAKFSFNVEARDITVNDLQNRPQALPRYDCNAFPFGQAS
ncbi:MAG: hypothetical protein NPIRA04_17570 [Nitrospirales bacterium]|nr:MAG: hypothetical protein NPIRA04_17570 [Nitrospirales bacterium]